MIDCCVSVWCVTAQVHSTVAEKPQAHSSPPRTLVAFQLRIHTSHPRFPAAKHPRYSVHSFPPALVPPLPCCRDLTRPHLLEPTQQCFPGINPSTRNLAPTQPRKHWLFNTLLHPPSTDAAPPPLTHSPTHSPCTRFSATTSPRTIASPPRVCAPAGPCTLTPLRPCFPTFTAPLTHTPMQL